VDLPISAAPHPSPRFPFRFLTDASVGSPKRSPAHSGPNVTRPTFEFLSVRYSTRCFLLSPVPPFRFRVIRETRLQRYYTITRPNEHRFLCETNKYSETANESRNIRENRRVGDVYYYREHTTAVLFRSNAAAFILQRRMVSRINRFTVAGNKNIFTTEYFGI